MKYRSRGFIFAAFLTLASTPLFAQTPDEMTPSGEDVCDGLLAEGTSPGLYGLCVAYCEAQDCDSYPEGEEPHSCNLLLSNYERKVAKADNDDPPMPCEGPVEPMCPCWSSEGEGNEFEAAGMGLPLDLCIFGFPSGQVDTGIVWDIDFVQYAGDGQSILFLIGEGACFYRNEITLPGERVEFGISPDEEDTCRFHVAELSMEWDTDGDPSTNCFLIP